MNEGKMIDASFTVAPRQRNKREKNKTIKEGRGEELWNDNLNKKNHKDIDADGRKRTTKHFSDIKITQKWTQRVNLLIITKLQMHLCMILNLWMIY